MEVGDKIRCLREEKGLTLEQLGNMVGVGKSTVRKWETGQIANMRRDKIKKLADALGVSPLDIIGIESNSEFLFSANDALDRFAFLLSAEQTDDLRDLFANSLSAQKLTPAFVVNASGAKHNFLSKLLSAKSGSKFKLPIMDAFVCAAYLGIDGALSSCLSNQVADLEIDLDNEDISLIRAWRKAPEKDRRIVAAALSDYGFVYDTPALHLAARGGADLTASPDPARIEAALRETKSETE